MSDPSDELDALMNDGWEVVGYSVCMMAAGALAQNILLRKGTGLKTCVIVLSAGKEIGRSFSQLSPMPKPEAKRGFFG